MCGIAGYVSNDRSVAQTVLQRMTRVLAHRGPDDEGLWQEGGVGLGNRRLAILDLSEAGHQPMLSSDDRYVVAYNGEVYNYLELRREIGGNFRTGTDTEVVLSAVQKWGVAALDRLNGMFGLAVWDRQEQALLLARDRFGVKPVYYGEHEGVLFFASEIKALAAAGVPIEADRTTWATFLDRGVYDHDEKTFFKGIYRLPPGHYLRWHRGSKELVCWYDLAERIDERQEDQRSDDAVMFEYQELLLEALKLRFRADVPVGVTLSGGLDSSVLVGALHRLFGPDAEISAFHYATGDARYDETPWVKRLLAGSQYPLHIALLEPAKVPQLALDVAYYQEEPFGGIPTLAQVQMYRLARETGVYVLLGGEGMDEQWAGYDYYSGALNGETPSTQGPVQASRSRATRPECLTPEIRGLASGWVPLPSRFGDRLRDWRYRDLCHAKIPRAVRFTDRSSSQHSCELREPFLDYRLVEFAFQQPSRRLIRDGEHKYLLRRLARSMLPPEVAGAPKRPVQTPQREWLRGPLRDWVEACLAHPAVRDSGWFDRKELHRQWQAYLRGESDNSAYVWQWISVALNGEVVRRLQEVRGN